MADDTTSDRTRRRVALTLLSLWAVFFVGSFVAFVLTPARDFGLTGGWNKVSVFMSWQLAATALAFVCLAMTRWFPGERLRRILLAPSGAMALLMAAAAALVIYGGNSRDLPAPVPDRPVTQPTTATN